MALGGAAAATFGVGKENVDAYAEELILLASTAYEAAVEATRLSEQATAAAKGLPEDGVISTKARRLIAQAEQARERARVAAQTAEACGRRQGCSIRFETPPSSPRRWRSGDAGGRDGGADVGGRTNRNQRRQR